MRIDCQHVWEHISAYIDGEVDAALRAEIDRHLETCEICSAVLDSTRNVVIPDARTARQKMELQFCAKELENPQKALSTWSTL